MNILDENFKVNRQNALSVLVESFMIAKGSSIAHCLVLLVLQKNSNETFDFIKYISEEEYMLDLGYLSVAKLAELFQIIPNVPGHERLNIFNFGEYTKKVLNEIVLKDLDKHGPELASRIDQCHDIDSLIRKEIQIQREYRSETVDSEINVD